MKGFAKCCVYVLVACIGFIDYKQVAASGEADGPAPSTQLISLAELKIPVHSSRQESNIQSVNSGPTSTSDRIEKPTSKVMFQRAVNPEWRVMKSSTKQSQRMPYTIIEGPRSMDGKLLQQYPILQNLPNRKLKEFKSQQLRNDENIQKPPPVYNDEGAEKFFVKLFRESIPRLRINHVRIRQFNQVLNHFKRIEPTTFTQRLYAGNTYYEENKKDGPVFLVVGRFDEATPDELESGPWYQLAQKFGALIYNLEQRYYGQSFPAIIDLKGHLADLGSAQLLADLEWFIDRSGYAKRKWIVFGKGYAGTLAAWFRLKFPHAVKAAVVYNAQLYATTENKEYYKLFDSVFDTPIKNNIREAYSKMRESITQNNYGDYQEKFKMCSSLDSEGNTETNTDFMFWSLTTFLVQVTKMQHEQFESFTEIVNMLTNPAIENAVGRFSEAVKRIMEILGENCLEVNYKKALKLYKNPVKYDYQKEYPKSLKFGLGILQTHYQRCTEYGNFETSDGKYTFGQKITLQFYVGLCSESFGEKFNSMAQLDEAVKTNNMIYGGQNIVMSNLLYISHGIKPGNNGGITESKSDGITLINIEVGKSASELQAEYDKISEILIEWTRKESDGIDSDLEDANNVEIQKSESPVTSLAVTNVYEIGKTDEEEKSGIFKIFNDFRRRLESRTDP